ncbi:MAG: methionyl-tRNA formyltransferase, partial [Pseudomonadota bacterium]
MKPHVVFMGSTDFACPILQNLIDHSLNIVRVYTQPPRKSGRHHTKLKSTPVEILARKLNLSVAYPTSFDQFALDDFAALQPDLVIVAAYGLILPAQLLQMAKQNYLNLHASLLPRWRGAAPIERAIMAGDDKTGVTLMKMEPKLDCGPIIDTIETTIKNNETGLELTQRLSSLAALLLEKHIKNALQHNLKARPQPRQGVSYAAKLSSLDGKINWQHDHRQIFNLLRALNIRISVFVSYLDQRMFVRGGVVCARCGLL